MPEVREQQATLSREHGVEAFCYWHYWFGGGRRVLERVFDEVLQSAAPDLSFRLGWANQSWTGIWHGAPGRVLVEQEYPGEHDADADSAFLERAFADPRYLRVQGKPAFYVTSPGDIPNGAAMFSLWRERAAAGGLGGLYVIGELPGMTAPAPDLHRRWGVDAVVPMRVGGLLPSPRNPLRWLRR